jgi:hypothetical protein
MAFLLPVSGQNVRGDSIATPEVKVQSPKKASIYSAILPGLGQAYNKKYWKIPIIYGGIGACIYFVDWNNSRYQLVRNAYIDLSVTEGFNEEEFLKRNSKIPFLLGHDYSNSVDKEYVRDYLTQAQAYYRRNRDLLVIGTAALYALNIIDASVDAHLYNFDISDDLTFNWSPSIITLENQKILCLNCSFNF